MTGESAKRPGRPRDEALTGRILDAARDELTAAGVDGFSIRQVARRAGVTRKAVTARWAGADELLHDAMGAIDELEFEPTGDLERDLTELGRKFIDGLASGALDLQLRVTADAPQHPEVYEALQQHVLLPMSRALVAAFKSAQTSGQVRDGDISWLVRGFVGALLAQTFQLPGRVAPSEQDLRELIVEVKRWSRP
ncbi:TetR/AcrR family transcriptional regulator [Mycolicibacterium flavescens]|uniref:TetR family transcriptional regulator n=1 Tax=Mycolicibacterium flavescens TaxID=1776 RepID=A0A1E3RDL2_MYCFV|nr:TetR/AcrR family transcriptional regulator [Mycolicibacterium flavescens]MCV7282399.1 TetR/AcrR family transcriptional regulator [Mycolicibacterium flavescens]ODQ87921.1 TetR family transcriptional regulator [Mycolicibacterium flavescens]